MKLRVTIPRHVDGAHRRTHDVSLTVAVTATVGEVARGLVRAGAGDPRLLPFAEHRQAPLTLRVGYPDGATLILDAGQTVAESGLLSGCLVEPVFEAAPGPGPRAKRPIAKLTVLDGPQKGVSFLAVQGENLIGRERGARVELHDRSVSRQHAILRSTGSGVEIADLGSANGVVLITEDGDHRELRSATSALPMVSTIEVGTVPIQVELGPPAEPDPVRSSTVPHPQSPRVDPVFAPEPLDLPAPPDRAEPARFPLIAMVAPLVMGTVLYLTTQSMMSLIFVALSPLIMLGTWVDSRLSKRKSTKQAQREFEQGIEQAREQLVENAEAERLARTEETPPPVSLLDLPSSRSAALWTRRPEHRAFLELRLGTATQPSRKRIALPPRGKISAKDWASLTELSDEFRTLPGIPVLERLDRSGSLGIAGPKPDSGDVARGLLVQLLALHSPADLVLTAFADAEQAEAEWAWLKWVPHIDSVFSPVPAPHLAADDRGANRLLTALEGLVGLRSAGASSRNVRSRSEGSAADAQERLRPAEANAAVPAVVVLVLSDALVDRTRLVGLAEDGADVGVHLIWVADEMRGIPAACRTVVEVADGEPKVHFVRQGEVVPLTEPDAVRVPFAETFARALSPIVDTGARMLDESDLPRSVSLGQIAEGEILASGHAILQRWLSSDSLAARWTLGTEREPGPLTAIVGQGSDGPVEIDLRTHGPHALVGGTTGSGKSEFLQTWILSLAANYSPDRLTFLLVDYKGGAAFADCVALPHTVGLVTDLTPHLVRRALTSLRAELRTREELLNEKGAKDLIALERRGDPEAPPTLVIVIDEFAALVSEIPEFVDGVIDVAQRGRSLGLHLVMATQRPAGVIKDNLRANTNLRIGLRMADPADSSDVLGVPDAADFAAEIPGRAAVKIGAARLRHFQTGYLGGRADSDRQDVVEVRDLGFAERAPWALAPEVRSEPERRGRGPRDIEVLAGNIRTAAKIAEVRQPRRPWVDQLPTVLPLERVLAHSRSSARSSSALPLGLADEPEAQRQSTYACDFGSAGNLVIYGGPGSGKSTSLLTIGVSAVLQNRATRIYGIDAAGGRLGALGSLPNVGDIVSSDDRDRVQRLLGLLRAEIAERMETRRDSPPTYLLIDGFAAFRDTYEHLTGSSAPFADLIEIARAGRTAGVHLALSCERAMALPAALAASVTERLALRLPSESDAQLLGVPTGVLDEADPGRALRISDAREIQFGVPGGDSDPAEIDAAIAALASDQVAHVAERPVGVPEIPTRLERADLPRADGGAPAFAIDTVGMEPVAVPTDGLMLVTGPAGSGRTTAVRSLLEALAERAVGSGRELDAVLIAPRRSALGSLPVWSEVADAPELRERQIERLARSLGGSTSKPAGLPLLPLIGPDAPMHEESTMPMAEAAPFPAPEHLGVVVIEDIGGFDGTGDESALASLLKLLRRSDLAVIVEGENATIGTVWELASPLRGARWALALQPDANDVPSLFTVSFAHAKRTDFPPGRGFLIRSGAQTGVHVGTPAGDVPATH